MNEWADYVRRLTGDAPQTQVGQQVGVDGSTISRWRSGTRPRKPAEVASLAMAYGGDVLEAFVAAGFLTPEQADAAMSEGSEDPRVAQIAAIEAELIRLEEEASFLDARAASIRERMNQLLQRRADLLAQIDADEPIEGAAFDWGTPDDVRHVMKSMTPDEVDLYLEHPGSHQEALGEVLALRRRQGMTGVADIAARTEDD